MGGGVNVGTKSGSNEGEGSVVSYLTPGVPSASPRRIYNWSTSLTGVQHNEYTADFGAEVGGPLIKNKLFFWVGYAPEVGRNHTVRYVDRFVDADGDGRPDGANGQPTLDPLSQA